MGSHHGQIKTYVGPYVWQKCGSGCSGHLFESVQQTKRYDMDPSTVVSFLRTPTVYVDKRRFWVYYKVTDEYGSPYFTQSSSNGFTLSPNTNDWGTELNGNTGCDSATTHGSRQTVWAYQCYREAQESEFSKTSSTTGRLKIVTGATEHDVGGSDVFLNQVTMAQTPDWWHLDLRPDGTLAAGAKRPSTAVAWPSRFPARPQEPLVIVGPTYPIYETETFQTHIYNVATYVGGATKVNQFEMYVYYDNTKVEYQGAQFDGYFDANKAAPIDDGSVVQLLLVGGADGTNINGWFRYASVTWKLKSGATIDTDGVHVDTGIYVAVNKFGNAFGGAVTVDTGQPRANFVVEGSPAFYGSIFDARLGATTYGSVAPDGVGQGAHALRVRKATQDDRFALFNYDDSQYEYNQDHGHIFNRRAIDGKDQHDVQFKSTVFNDRMWYNEMTTAISGNFYRHAPASTTCASVSGANYETNLQPGSTNMCQVRAKIALGTDTSNSRIRGTAPSTNGCLAQTGNTCTGTADFRIVSPTSLSIVLSNNHLKRIVPVGSDGSCITSQSSCTSSSCQTKFQTTKVTVFADGVDVTSWATGMNVYDANSGTVDTSNAKFLSSPGSTAESPEYKQNLVRGIRAASNLEVRLHGQPGAASASFQVDDSTLATVTETIPRVITGIGVHSTGSDMTYDMHSSGTTRSSFSDVTTVSVDVMQVFTQRPVGNTKSHYGYVFMTVVYDDGTLEDLIYEDMDVPAGHTANLISTPSGSSDSHAGNTLALQNSATQRWMISVSKTATTECV
ncbi:MAG: hypothetical protein CMA64_08530, partial [Euryarchaeota archaeon]|nr:hypothetical protein [Euryarchaeota archaeon]